MTSQALRAEKAHTATPWVRSTGPLADVRAGDAITGKKIANTMYAEHKGDDAAFKARIEECRANAEFIVLAVNCHDELVDEASKVVAFLESTGMTTKFLDGLRAAIARATGASK